MFSTNSERLIGISDAFSAFVYGYPSSCPCAHCTPNKSVTTLRYTRRHELWALNRHLWCLFLPLFMGIRHLAHVLTVPPTKVWLLCATPAGMDLYIQPMPVGTYWVQSPGFPKIVYLWTIENIVDFIAEGSLGSLFSQTGMVIWCGGSIWMGQCRVHVA